MRYCLFVLILFVIGFAHGFSSKVPNGPPDGTSIELSEKTSNEVEKPEPSKKQAHKALLDEVMSLAEKSSCAKTPHDVQGTPPKSYVKGIALSYVNTLCHPETEAHKVATKPLGASNVDALAHYGLKPKDETERLQMLYALILGSAARESSWRWCVGRDIKAKEQDRITCVIGDGSTCEAGYYQTSSNSQIKSPALSDLFKQNLKSSEGCFAEVYKGSVTCSEANLKNWGIGEHKDFQRLSKDCPGFATEYHAVMLRVSRRHYGPINTKLATVKSQCVQMFKDIKAKVDKTGCNL